MTAAQDGQDGAAFGSTAGNPHDRRDCRKVIGHKARESVL